MIVKRLDRKMAREALAALNNWMTNFSTSSLTLPQWRTFVEDEMSKFSVSVLLKKPLTSKKEKGTLNVLLNIRQD